MCGPDKNDLNPYFKGPVATGLGATEILIGVFCVGFGIWGLLIQTSFFYILFPVWCGVLGIIGGSLITATAARPAKIMINAALGLSIISIIGGAVQIVFSTFAFLDVRDAINIGMTYCFNQTNNANFSIDCAAIDQTINYLCTNWINGYICTPDYDVNTGYSIVLACMAAGALQIIIALAAAIICCDCCMKTPPNKVFPISTTSNGTKSGSGGGPPLMVSKTIQADFRPRTIRAKSMALQTENSYLSEANPQQVNPTVTQQTNGQQIPPIYILPMGAGQPPYQGYPQNPPYYPPETYTTQPRRPPPNRDWVRPDNPQELTTSARKNSQDKPRRVANVLPTENHIPRNYEDEIVRIGDKTIHIHQS